KLLRSSKTVVETSFSELTETPLPAAMTPELYSKPQRIIDYPPEMEILGGMSPAERRDILVAADQFAERKHKGQYRRDGIPCYIEHPRGVMAIVRDEFGVSDPDTLAAALLHDTIEDTATDYDEILDRFGRKVADLVAVLTKDKRLPEAKREREY